MITYTTATAGNMGQIARLHTENWQKFYRGIWSDEFLDGPVVEDRRKAWTSRFMHPQDNQHIMVAMEEEVLAGFVCLYFDDDPLYGHLIENLHVSEAYQGRGIGGNLFKMSAQLFDDRDAGAKFYLWVYEENYSARKFYENLGAINQEVLNKENPGGTYSQTCRYVWPTVLNLV